MCVTSHILSLSGQARYEGVRDLKSLLKFVMDSVPPAPVIVLTDGSLKKAVTGMDRPWVISVCSRDDDCVSESTLNRVALSLQRLAHVGLARCESGAERICEMLGRSEVFFVPLGDPTNSLNSIMDKATGLSSMVTQDIVFSALRLLPQPNTLTPTQLSDLLDKTGMGEIDPVLVAFGTGQLPLEFIRLMGHLNNKKVLKYFRNACPNSALEYRLKCQLNVLKCNVPPNDALFPCL
eukprot:sb/3469228/